MSSTNTDLSRAKRFDEGVSRAVAGATRAFRATRRLDQAAVAGVLGVGRVTVTKIESGQRPASIGEIVVLCEFFEVDFREFLLVGMRGITDEEDYAVTSEALEILSRQVWDDDVVYNFMMRNRPFQRPKPTER